MYKLIKLHICIILYNVLNYICKLSKMEEEKTSREKKKSDPSWRLNFQDILITGQMLLPTEHVYIYASP